MSDLIPSPVLLAILQDKTNNVTDEQVDSAVNKYLTDNPVQAYDDSEIKSDIGELKEDLDTLNQGGLNLKEDFIGKQVNEWLDEHPEATTTVLDASITDDKFTDALRKKKANYYISVEKMKEDESLVVGTVCVTLGYYEPNDGGGATYRVREKKTTDIDDGGSIHFLSDDLVAELIVGDYVTPEQFGAKGDGVFDSANAIQSAINYAVKKQKIVFTFLSMTFSKSILLNARNIEFHSYGTLTYTGNDYAIKSQFPRQKIYIYKLLSPNGGGIQIDTSEFNVEYVDIDMKFAECLKECYCAVTSNNHYIAYTKAFGDCWKTNNDGDVIKVAVGTDGRFIGECIFNGMKVIGATGITIDGLSVSAVKCYDVSLENLTVDGIYIKDAKNCCFINMRYSELMDHDGTKKVVKLDGSVSGFKFIGTYMLEFKCIDLEKLVDGCYSIVIDTPISFRGNHIADGISICNTGKSFVNPKSTTHGFNTEETDNFEEPIYASGISQCISFGKSIDASVTLSEYHNSRTFPYIIVQIPGSKTYTIKNHKGEVIATLNDGWGKYLVSLDPLHVVIKI